MLKRLIDAVVPEVGLSLDGVGMVSVQKAMIMLYRREVDMILDVRTTREFDYGHIPGAVLVPEAQLASRIAGLGVSRESVILVYCHTHVRSIRAARVMTDMGFENVHVLRGGIVKWESVSLPVEVNGAIETEGRTYV